MRPWISSAVADGTVFAWFIHLRLNVCSPRQVGDVYTKVLEAAHPLHRSPTDYKRSVGVLSLPEVHNQLFGFAHIQRETVVLAPLCKSLYLIQVCGLIIVGNEAQNQSIISKFNNRSGAVRGGHAVMCVERVEQRTQDTALWGSYVQGDGVGGELATTCGLPVRKSWIQSQRKEFRLRSVSLTASMMGTIVLKAEL